MCCFREYVGACPTAVKTVSAARAAGNRAVRLVYGSERRCDSAAAANGRTGCCPPGSTKRIEAVAAVVGRRRATSGPMSSKSRSPSPSRSPLAGDGPPKSASYTAGRVRASTKGPMSSRSTSPSISMSPGMATRGPRMACQTPGPPQSPQGTRSRRTPAGRPVRRRPGTGTGRSPCAERCGNRRPLSAPDDSAATTSDAPTSVCRWPARCPCAASNAEAKGPSDTVGGKLTTTSSPLPVPFGSVPLSSWTTSEAITVAGSATSTTLTESCAIE